MAGKRKADEPRDPEKIKSAAAVAGEEASEYERQRLEHIRRNKEYMTRMGVLGAAESLRPVPNQRDGNKSTKEAKKRVKLEPQIARRSSRLSGKQVEYTGEAIDRLFEEDCEERKRVKVERKTNRQEELVALTRDWLRQSRELMHQHCFEDAAGAPQSEQEWRQEAERRWGSGVASTSQDVDWKNYVLSRMSHPPIPSPMSLLQEFYAHDPWRLLVCCVLMSRVGSTNTKHTCTSNFFEKYPTPTAFIEAKYEECQEILYPLGLFPNRLKSLIALSNKFLSDEAFEVGLEGKNKIFGIGQFGLESYLIFCKGMTDIKPKDCTLRSFCSWQQKQAANGDQEPERLM